MWSGAACVLLVLLVVVGVAGARATRHGKALVWVQLAGVLGVMLLVVLAQSSGRPVVFAVPVTFAVMSVVGMVAFLRLCGGDR